MPSNPKCFPTALGETTSLSTLFHLPLEKDRFQEAPLKRTPLNVGFRLLHYKEGKFETECLI